MILNIKLLGVVPMAVEEIGIMEVEEDGTMEVMATINLVHVLLIMAGERGVLRKHHLDTMDLADIGEEEDGATMEEMDGMEVLDLDSIQATTMAGEMEMEAGTMEEDVSETVNVLDH